MLSFELLTLRFRAWFRLDSTRLVRRHHFGEVLLTVSRFNRATKSGFVTLLMRLMLPLLRCFALVEPPCGGRQRLPMSSKLEATSWGGHRLSWAGRLHVTGFSPCGLE